jgi:hypothetical protein
MSLEDGDLLDPEETDGIFDGQGVGERRMLVFLSFSKITIQITQSSVNILKRK